MEVYDLFLQDYKKGLNFYGDEDVEQRLEKYEQEKRNLGIKLINSTTGYHHMGSILLNFNIRLSLVKKEKLCTEKGLTNLGEKYITLYLNEVYLEGLENILDIYIPDLEMLENFFDELQLNPYKNDRVEKKYFIKKQ